MSENFVIATILQYGRYDKNNDDLDDRRRRMKDEATLADEMTINNFIENVLETGRDDLDGTETNNQLIEYMIDIINQFFDDVLPTNKTCEANDVTWENVGECTLWITGGMTWGDDSSESYGKFELFNALPKKIKMAGGFK